MSELCDSACAEFYEELDNVCRIGRRAQNQQSGTEILKILQILFRNIALSSSLTAATASAKHFGVKK